MSEAKTLQLPEEEKQGSPTNLARDTLYFAPTDDHELKRLVTTFKHIPVRVVLKNSDVCRE